MERPKKTGIIYARVSSAEQVDGTSLEFQERACRMYSIKENIDILRVFIEKGESAKTANRTELNKAVLFCTQKKQQKVDYFIVHKLDRFSRNQTDHAILRSNLRRFGTQLRSVTEPINESPTGRLMEAVISGVAEFDNSVKAERSKNGMRERFRQGVWCWPAPPGYTRLVKGGNLIPDPNTAPYIQLAFEEYSKGNYSFKKLAAFLDTRGFRTRTNKKPCAQFLEKVLRNHIYYGNMRVWGEEHRGSFEPIISEDLFWRCQPGARKNKFRSLQRSTINPNFPLRKLVICMECQAPITGSASTGRKGIKYPYYHHHRSGCSIAKSIPKEKFETEFVAYLRSISPEKKYEKIFKAIVIDVWKSKYKKLDEEHRRIEKEISTLKENRQKIFDAYQAAKYTDEEFFEQKKLINERIAARELLRDEKRVEEFDMEEALNHCFNLIRNTAKTWVELEEVPALRGRFQNQIFPEKVMFDGKKFGTAKIPLIFKLNQKNTPETSDLVIPFVAEVEPWPYSNRSWRT